MAVEFDETTYTARAGQTKQPFSLIGMLIRMKIVSTEAAAQKVLLGLAVLFFALAAWYSFTNLVTQRVNTAELRKVAPPGFPTGSAPIQEKSQP